MRDIRFRAWDKVDKLMYYNVQNGIDFDDNSNYEFRRFLGSQFQKADDYHEWILMQYTGLKDKNGKEIYEGDVVKHSGRLKSIIRFDEEDVGFKMFNKTMGRMHPSKEFFSKAVEIIGNIHENSEILTPKQEKP